MEQQFKIKLILVSDDKFDGNHPNGIVVGTERIGWTTILPVVNRRFYIHRSVNEAFETSTVTEVLDNQTFKTKNSTYKWEILK